MLLFSTILDIDSALGKDEFIKMVIDWNQNSPHQENIIKGIVWNGERNIKFENENLSLEIQEYRNRNIIAIRYIKAEDDGIIWYTDYVMNFNEFKMSIQLDRSYKEDSLISSQQYSTPFFITNLINSNFIIDDHDLPVLYTPIYIDKDKISTLSSIIINGNKYTLPVVYVSKTIYNTDPIDVSILAKKLKGIAHVLVEKSVELNAQIRQECDSKNEYYGSIGIYFPNNTAKNRRIYYRDSESFSEIAIKKITSNIINYTNAKIIDTLYTWQGVNISLLGDRLLSQRQERINAEEEKEKAKNETQTIFDTFNDDLEKLKAQVNELTNNNEALKAENIGLREKLASDRTPVLYLGEEEDFFTDEIKDVVLSALTEALTNAPTPSRYRDILSDIIEENNYSRILENRKTELKNALKSYQRMTSTIKQKLSELGIEIISEDGKHYKLGYYNDSRYIETLSKTPSNDRGIKNTISQIINKFF